MEFWPDRPPLRRGDAVLSAMVYLAGCGVAWVIWRYGLPYRDMARQRTRPGHTHLPPAYAVAFLSLVGALLLAGRWTLRALRERRPAWPYALLTLPLLAEAWLLGFAAALVVVSV
ncbi:hypothetical protein C5E45_05605 [Nocardia nova]|uniref:Uncharacterized protein n=1 Tax=Nocardia nova TaxID=37330 RepID=A0A2S6AUW8_9NOCA|nr:hypothetical protein [Nocardia nova]PPJ32505.1 hypothetical protein C5E41_05115 [Nocardia nova]PPJ38984.1 hypothetical protein C5E45_05605 [Nocardia nova]